MATPNLASGEKKRDSLAGEQVTLENLLDLYRITSVNISTVILQLRLAVLHSSDKRLLTPLHKVFK